MLQSIFIYGFIILVVYYCFRIDTYWDNGTLAVKRTDRYKYNYAIGVFVIVFFLAVRWEVGRDYANYLEEYLSLYYRGHNVRSDMEPGYVLWMKVFAALGLHFSVFFGAVAFVQCRLTLSYFKHEKYLLPYFGFLIMTGNIFFMWSNIVRHTIVIALFLFVSRLTMEKRRFWLYALFILAASTVHFSAVLLLPLYVIFFLDLERFHISRKLQYLLFFGSLVLSSTSIWQNLLQYADVIFSLIGYDRYSSDLLLSIGGREMAFGPRRIILAMIDLTIITYSKELRSAFRTKTFGFSHILFVIYYTFMPVFMDSMAFSRIFDYFQIGRIMMASYLLFDLFKYRRNKANYLVGVFVVMLFLLHLFIQIYSDNGADAIRYQFFWNHRLPSVY